MSSHNPRPHIDIPAPNQLDRLHRTASSGWIPYAPDGQRNDSRDFDATPVPRERSQFLTPDDASTYSPTGLSRSHHHWNSYSGHSQALDAAVYEGPPRADFVEGSSTSRFDPAASTWQFPEPDLSRSASLRSLPSPPGTHRHARSDVGPQVFRTSSYSPPLPDVTPRDFPSDQLSDQLSAMTLTSEEGLRRFQAGELPSQDEEWYRLVPETAREALGKKEVQRQSALFEIFKSERDYTSDLEAVQQVFVEPLRSSDAIPEDQRADFIKEVFWNLDEILSFHQRMLGNLFARQRDQHPLVHSVSDIILETVLQFRPAYENYIKHYPLAEARHRREARQNPRYRAFLETAAHDARISKRDLVTFLSRPVTRLPRLSLVLEHIERQTDEEHPDRETIPLITGILGDFIKSTQPGIESAENKVKLLNLYESLVFRRGEIIDLDFHDESRSLVLSGTLARRQRSETDWHGWNDYFVVLLDHYLLITREVKQASGMVKYDVASRPIPLELLRLGKFDEPPEQRKEKSEDSSGLLSSLTFHFRPVFPFTVYHAGSKLVRRYTLYTNSEASRKKWHDGLVNAMTVYGVRQDSNKWFAPSTINDGIFRVRTHRVPANSKELFTGRITAAAGFTSAGKNYLAVGCTTGIYVGVRGELNFVKVLGYQSASSIVALQDFNRLLVHHESSLVSYSLDLLARVSQNQASADSLKASLEHVSAADHNVVVFRVGHIKDRTIVLYTNKSFRQTTIYALEAVRNPTRPFHRTKSGGPLSFRSFGDPFYVPRAAYDITPLAKTVAISTERGVTIVDPTNLASSSVLLVPDFSQAQNDARIASLKSRCDAAKPLGLARVDLDENMVVYEEFGCYINRHGFPKRNASFVRWECRATTFVQRWDHILLFSADFVEVRHLQSGRLVQVIDGQDMRLLNIGPPPGSPVMMAKLGSRNDASGISDELLELVKTSEISAAMNPSSPMARQEFFGEWDM